MNNLIQNSNGIKIDPLEINLKEFFDERLDPLLFDTPFEFLYKKPKHDVYLAEFLLNNHKNNVHMNDVLTKFQYLRTHIQFFHTLTEESQKEIEQDNSFNSKIVKILLYFEEKSKDQFDEILYRLTCKEIFFL